MTSVWKKTTLRILPVCLVLVAQACNLGAAPKSADATATSPTLSPTTAAATNTEFIAAISTANSPLVAATPTATPTETATSAPAAITYPLGPTGFPPNVDPLTGLQVSDPSILQRRPIAVKVSNFPRNARPQAGLSKADVIMEWYTEEGDTRFIGLYYGKNAEKVGPIRSVRIEDFSFTPLYDSILVYMAGYAPVIQRMNLLGIDGVEELGVGSMGALWRDDETVNGVFADTAKMTQYVQHIGLDPASQPNLDGLVFDPNPPTDYASSLGIRMVYSYWTDKQGNKNAAIGEWKYDLNLKQYIRFSENDAVKMVPLMDRMTNTQLAVDNLAVLLVPWTRCSGGATETYEFNLANAGPAFFFRDGKVRPGQWKSGGANVPLRFLEEDGSNYKLHPGASYITVIPYVKGLPLEHIYGVYSSTEYEFNGNPNVTVMSAYGEMKPLVSNGNC